MECNCLAIDVMLLFPVLVSPPMSHFKPGGLTWGLVFVLWLWLETPELLEMHHVC